MDSNLSQRIKVLREKKGWSQADFAEESGISASAISQFENGGRMPSAPILRKLANALDTTTDYLLGVEESVQDAEAKAYFRNLQELDPRDRELILKQIQWLKEKKK